VEAGDDERGRCDRLGEVARGVVRALGGDEREAGDDADDGRR
jgi:hypothetical protein